MLLPLSPTDHGSPNSSPVTDRKRLSSGDSDPDVEENSAEDREWTIQSSLVMGSHRLPSSCATDAWQQSFNSWYSEQTDGLRQAEEELRRMEELLAEAAAKLGSSWVPNAVTSKLSVVIHRNSASCPRPSHPAA